jgi:nickel transport protein
VLLAAVLAAGLTLPGRALAHQVNVFAVAESGVLRGEGYFGGGAKARDCAVEAVDALGAVVASGRTGQDGTFVLTLPPAVAAPLTVALKAGEGHRGEYTLTAVDLGASARPEAFASTRAAPSPPAAPDPAAPFLDESRLAGLVEAAAARAVEEKLAPLKLELARMAAREDSAKLRDVIGGLGWIAGLLGLAAWLKRPRS